MIVETRRNYEDQETYRQKRCPRCDHESFTIEYEVDQDEKFISTWRRHARTKM